MDEVTVERVALESVSFDSVNVATSLIDSEPPTSIEFPKSAHVIHSRHLSEDLSAFRINDLRVNNGEKNCNEQIEGNGISNHGHIRHFSADLSSFTINDLYANKGEEKRESRPNSAERNIYKAAEIAERFIQSIDNRVLVDTGAPIESVKEAVSKFGGILDWKERRKNVQNALDKALEDAPEYQRRAEAADVEKNKVLMELCSTRRTIEGLKINLEKAQTEAIQAQQDSELANIRFKEIQQGIACRESAAAKAEIDLAKYRHANALAELQSVTDELEQLQKEYTSLNTKRDNAKTKACESNAASQEIEKTVDDLTLKLIALKQSLTSSQATHIIAEEHKLNVALAYQQEKAKWQNDLKQVDKEVQKIRDAISVNKDLKSKVEVDSTLLVKLQDEFSTYLKGESPQEVSPDGEVGRPMVSARVKLAKNRKELEDMRTDIKKAKDEVRILWNVAATLRADIEREEADLGALRHKEHSSYVSASSIQEELSNKTYELNIVHERTKAAEMPAELQEATKVMEQANSKAQMARHEVAKAKEEAGQAKAQVNVIKLRLEAVSREILAVNASEEIATASANALQEYKQETQIDPQADRISNNYMTLSLEEYDALIKKGQDAENLAKKRVIKAIEKIKQAKDAEVRSLNQLEQLAKQINGRKLELRAAQEKANSAQYGKLTMENELRKRRAKHEQQGKSSESALAVAEIPNLKNTSWSFDATSSTSNSHMVGALSRADTIAATRVKEPKPRKSLFPRSIVAMFASRKKTH
ncbi:Protein WEAK CHLOROPLAST MOVEMENT UNDER BLUE LIGHT 1 [Dichanthelium oligosanthes]|uniref:Protein WEAK CHLOROPLAST MOVEMENT UNDER BLUE LIGHT 1 n=1 Tax=Dichanthelium oligosanthes TaxID=888268 RepID=A0A1E5WBD1_9POAL|nr:Protein WEAK CHLOROPLAST MOVEMENT UNDER BLUE LIGHT 1 [Dichanthelium oligosanthes]